MGSQAWVAAATGLPQPATRGFDLPGDAVRPTRGPGRHSDAYSALHVGQHRYRLQADLGEVHGCPIQVAEGSAVVAGVSEVTLHVVDRGPEYGEPVTHPCQHVGRYQCLPAVESHSLGEAPRLVGALTMAPTAIPAGAAPPGGHQPTPPPRPQKPA